MKKIRDVLSALILLFSLLAFAKCSFSQDSSSVYNKLYNFPDKFFRSVNYDDNGDFILKDESFVKWSNDIYRLFKKKFLRKSDFDKDFLFSDNAINWMRENKAQVDVAGLKAYA